MLDLFYYLFCCSLYGFKCWLFISMVTNRGWVEYLGLDCLSGSRGGREQRWGKGKGQQLPHLTTVGTEAQLLQIHIFTWQGPRKCSWRMSLEPSSSDLSLKSIYLLLPHIDGGPSVILAGWGFRREALASVLRMLRILYPCCHHGWTQKQAKEADTGSQGHLLSHAMAVPFGTALLSHLEKSWRGKKIQTHTHNHYFQVSSVNFIILSVPSLSYRYKEEGGMSWMRHFINRKWNKCAESVWTNVRTVDVLEWKKEIYSLSSHEWISWNIASYFMEEPEAIRWFLWNPSHTSNLPVHMPVWPQSLPCASPVHVNCLPSPELPSTSSHLLIAMAAMASPPSGIIAFQSGKKKQ